MRRPPLALLRRLARTARAAVAAAGPLARNRRRRGLRIERKGEGDFVTDVDRAVEARLRRELLAEWPEHGFLGEETGVHAGDAEFVWVVDPIDGTSNFACGLPHWAVSAACLHRGQPVVAAAWVEPEALVYSAVLGDGARRGRQRLRAPRARLDDAALLGVQCFRGEFDPGWLGPVMRSGARVRVLGSTVTQLCDVAAGRLHGNVQSQGRLWDIAAAALVATEAGARFTDWQGRPIFPVEDPLADRHYASLTAGPAVHRALLACLTGR